MRAARQAPADRADDQPAQAAARARRRPAGPATRPALRLRGPHRAGRVCSTRAVRASGGIGHLERQPVGAARVHPAEQRVDQPVHHLVAVPLADQRADRDVLAGGEQRAAGVAVAVRRRPRHRTERARSAGTPISVPAGIGSSSPPTASAAGTAAGCTSWSARPSRSTSCDGGRLGAVGGAHQERLGAALGGHAGQLAGAQFAAEGAGLLVHDDLGVRAGVSRAGAPRRQARRCRRR